MYRKFLLLIAFLLPLSVGTATAETKGVIATIKPLHSLVAGVVGDSGTAEILVTGNTSPHDFQLKPSQVKNMQDARIIFYIDDVLETFLQRVFETLPNDVRKVAVIRDADLTLLPYRKKELWEPQAHDDHDDEHHDEHHSDHHDDEHHSDHHDDEHHDEHNGDHHDDEHHDDEHHDEHNGDHHDDEHHDDHHEEHAGHHDHHHPESDYDVHVWLDIENAKRMIALIVKELSAVYPEHQDTYRANAQNYIAKLSQLNTELSTYLLPVQNKPFIVFHDAYQYLEHAYGLSYAGAITFEGRAPSPNRISMMRERLKQTKATCIFKEPQFSDRLIKTVSEGFDMKVGILDPLGAEFAADEDLYFKLLRNLAQNLKQCLA